MKLNPRLPPKREIKNQKLIGTLVLAGTYAAGIPLLYFLVFAPPSPANHAVFEEETGWPLQNYHVLFLCMFPTVFWLWALLAWLGMKWFRHG